MDGGEGDAQNDQKLDNGQRLPEELREIPPQLARSLLPLETWENVLFELKDPKDILSSCDVCSNWKLLLQNKITTAQFQLLFPKLIPYLGTNDLLWCSGVSKEWNHLTANAVQSFRTDTFIWAEDHRLPCLSLEDSHEQSQIVRFLEEKELIGNEFNNSFPYAHVEFSEDADPNNQRYDAEELDPFCQNIQRFVERFGIHIHQLELACLTNSFVREIKLLVTCLNNTPNLQALVIRFDTWHGTETINDVNAFLAASPLPHSNLQELCLDERDHNPQAIMEVLILRYGNQLTFIDNFLQIPIATMHARGITFENLKVIWGTLFGVQDVRGRRNPSQVLDSFTRVLRKLNGTLTKIGIRLRGNFDSLRLNFAYFFKAINQHQPQIKEFHLVTKYPRGMHFQVSFPVHNLECMEMPNLKLFYLDEIGFPEVQIFQKATPALEYLEIDRQYNTEGINPDVFLHGMWKSLPKCKQICLNNLTFSRPPNRII